MSATEKIEEFQNILKDKLVKDLNIQTSEEFETFIRNFEKSENFQPFQSKKWHNQFYSEFKQSFDNIQQCDLDLEVLEVSKVLKKLKS